MSLTPAGQSRRLAVALAGLVTTAAPVVSAVTDPRDRGPRMS